MNFDSLLSNEESGKKFVSWFWDGSNGNELIEIINSRKYGRTRPETIRRVQHMPHIYCIVLNNYKTPGKSKDGKVQWRYCKVGYTEIDTTTGTNNRMEQVLNDIKKEMYPSVLFVLDISPTDSGKIRDIEKRIRNDIGWPVNPSLMENLGLPNKTEWVLTTQSFIYKIKTKIDDIKKEKKATTELFKNLKFRRDKENKQNIPQHLEINDDHQVEAKSN